MTDARAFRGFRFPAEVILWAMRWYLRFPVSYRDLELKLHLGVDAGTGWIEAVELTTSDAGDGSRVGPPLDQVEGAVASFTGDGAYDREDVYGAVADRHPEAAVVVPPRRDAVPSAAAETAPTRRGRHLQLIAERGRLGWQKASGYNRRALAEAAVSRYERVVGDALRSRTDRRRATEVAIAVQTLNRMLELGRPESVRITRAREGVGLDASVPLIRVGVDGPHGIVCQG